MTAGKSPAAAHSRCIVRWCSPRCSTGDCHRHFRCRWCTGRNHPYWYRASFHPWPGSGLSDDDHACEYPGTIAGKNPAAVNSHCIVCRRWSSGDCHRHFRCPCCTAGNCSYWCHASSHPWSGSGQSDGCLVRECPGRIAGKNPVGHSCFCSRHHRHRDACSGHCLHTHSGDCHHHFRCPWCIAGNRPYWCRASFHPWSCSGLRADRHVCECSGRIEDKNPAARFPGQQHCPAHRKSRSIPIRHVRVFCASQVSLSAGRNFNGSRSADTRRVAELFGPASPHSA